YELQNSYIGLGPEILCSLQYLRVANTAVWLAIHLNGDSNAGRDVDTVLVELMVRRVDNCIRALESHCLHTTSPPRHALNELGERLRGINTEYPTGGMRVDAHKALLAF